MTPVGPDGSLSLIDEIVREGARRMLAEALQAEVDAYIAQFVSERDENGHRLVVRNGSHHAGAGGVAGQLADATGYRFRSSSVVRSDDGRPAVGVLSTAVNHGQQRGP